MFGDQAQTTPGRSLTFRESSVRRSNYALPLLMGVPFAGGLTVLTIALIVGAAAVMQRKEPEFTLGKICVIFAACLPLGIGLAAALFRRELFRCTMTLDDEHLRIRGPCIPRRIPYEQITVLDASWTDRHRGRRLLIRDAKSTRFVFFITALDAVACLRALRHRCPQAGIIDVYDRFVLPDEASRVPASLHHLAAWQQVVGKGFIVVSAIAFLYPFVAMQVLGLPAILGRWGAWLIVLVPPMGAGLFFAGKRYLGRARLLRAAAHTNEPRSRAPD
jgi:hypothetical protein